jgi:ABC-type glutathione transport system ATPase component
MAPLRNSYPAPVPGRVVVVGVCAAGKSTLVALLRAAGYAAQSCAQEHSYVGDMWRRLSRPQALVFLDASLAVSRQRRRASYEPEYIAEQRRRLAHARAHCHVYLFTDDLTPEQVRDRVVMALAALGVEPSAGGAELATF